MDYHTTKGGGGGITEMGSNLYRRSPEHFSELLPVGWRIVHTVEAGLVQVTLHPA